MTVYCACLVLYTVMNLLKFRSCSLNSIFLICSLLTHVCLPQNEQVYLAVHILMVCGIRGELDQSICGTQ